VNAALGPPVQLAFAVNDIRAAAIAHHATFGSGPFFVIDHIGLESAHHQSQPVTFDHSSAYGQWGDTMVELICVHHNTAASLRAVMPTTGLHHSAHMVDDIDTVVAAIDATVELDAVTKSGLRFVMCSPSTPTGCLIELYQPTPHLQRFYAMVAQTARGWDGNAPVRELG
jgi:hypothetical protein